MSDGTRQNILDALAAIIAEDGLSSMSLRKVAARAGVSHATPGAAFGDRAGMITVFATEGFRRLRVALERAPAGDDGPADVAAALLAYIMFALEEPDVFETMFRPDLLRADDPDYLAAAREAHAPLDRAFARCVREGWLSPAEVAPRHLAAWSLAHGFATLWRSQHLGRADLAPAARRVTDTVAADLRRRPVTG